MQFIKFHQHFSKPFKDFDFDTFNVYKLKDFVLRTPSDLDIIYQKIRNEHPYVELWSIPMKVNLRKDLGTVLERFEEIGQQSAQTFLNTMLEGLPEGYRTVQATFIVVKKEDSATIVKFFEDLDFNVTETKSSALKEISVYGPYAENAKEVI